MRSGFNSPTAHNFMLAPARFFLLSPSLCLPLPSFLSSLTILFRLSFCPHSLPSSPAGDPSPPPPASRSPRTHRCLASFRRLALRYVLSASISNLEKRKSNLDLESRIVNRDVSPRSRPDRASSVKRRLSAELVCVVCVGVLCVVCVVCVVCSF